MDETDLEDDELGMKASDILARSAANPYNEQLAGMLDKYLGQQQEVTRKKKEILDAATKKLLERGKPTAMDQAAELFRISAAFGKPTKTGAFGETLANVGETAAGILEKRGKTSEEMRDLLLKYQLQGLDLDTEASKTQLEALTALTKAAGTKKETTSETERLAKIVNDPNVPKDQREIARRRLEKLTYIKPETGTGVGGQAQSSAGKTAADMGFTPGTPEFNRKVEELTKTGEGARLTPRAETELFEAQDKIAAGKDVIRQFERALKLNDVAYAGRTSGIRESIGSVIPIVSESDAQTATAELENIVLSAALGQLKAIFGAAPTEGERKILIDVQGSINKPKETRKRIWEAAQKAAARRIKSNEEKIKNIQSGAYMRQSDSEPENFAVGGPVLQAAGNYAKRSGLQDQPIPMKDGGLSLANIGRAGAQGLGFGWGDEAIARVRAQMEGRPYEEVLAEERLALEEFGKRYPLTALTSEIAGAALPTAAAVLMPGGQPAAAANIARYGTQMARMVPKALRGQTGRMAGAGGAAGIVAGAGTSTEGNRLSGAIEGGLTGSVAGPILGKATDLAGTFGKNLYDRFRRGPMSVDEKAERKVLEAMARDEMDPSEMRARMQTDRDLGVNSMLMDVSPSMQTLGEATVTMPGSGRKTLGGPLAERLEEGRERVAERAFRDVGKGVDFTEQEASLVGRLRANASNMYENAYAKGSVNDPRIMRVLEDDTFKKAYDEARDIARVEAKAAELRGEDPSKFALEKIYEVDSDGNVVKVNVPDVRTLDYIKRGIDSLIDKGYKGAGMSTAQATALKDLKKEFVKVIDENVPEYAAARAQYKGDIEVLDALRFGNEKFLKTVPNQAQKMIADMSVAEKDALRAGVAQSILSKVLDSPRQENAAQKIIGSPNTQKRLRMLFDNQAEYEIFEAALTREADMFRSAQEILRNSRTANKKEAIEDLKKSTSRIFDIAGEAIEVSTGNPGSIIGKTLRYLQARATLDEATAGRIAQILKSGTEDEVNTVLQRLERQAGKFGAEQQTRLGRQQSASRIAGTVLPQPESLAMPPAEEEPEEDVDAIVERLLSGENQ